jgi:hypothetical protein
VRKEVVLFLLNPSQSRAATTARNLVRRALPWVDEPQLNHVEARREALEGYVICLELGEATIVVEGNVFAFQVPEGDLRIGQPVRFVRRGDRFELV